MRNELKDVNNLLRKFERIRLEYDYNRCHPGKVTRRDVEKTRRKFRDTESQCRENMKGFLNRQSDQILLMGTLTECIREFHVNCHALLDSLVRTLVMKFGEIPGACDGENGVPVSYNSLSPTSVTSLNENIYIDLSKLTWHPGEISVHGCNMEIRGHQRENEYYRSASLDG